MSFYRLRGIVVHSGQASGGHYYSFIRNKDNDGEFRWYKFDDGDVTEIKMDDEEELKAQCYGGEYMSEVFDPLVKRMSYRKQKRWWNAFMLFYTRLDYTEDENTSLLKEMALLSISGRLYYTLGLVCCSGGTEKPDISGIRISKRPWGTWVEDFSSDFVTSTYI